MTNGTNDTTCETCGLPFDTEEELKQHENVAHGDSPVGASDSV